MKFRKKPVVIEAIQYKGLVNRKEVMEFMRNIGVQKYSYLIIPTLEGDLKIVEGDWVIKGIKGEFYPCKPDIFKETYDKVE